MLRKSRRIGATSFPKQLFLRCFWVHIRRNGRDIRPRSDWIKLRILGAYPPDYAIDDLILKLSPFVFDYHDKIDESWRHGVLFGGLSEFSDTFYLANSYKLAGDELIGVALKNEAPWDLFCPAVYNYRHATELYLKSVFGSSKQTHNLKTLFEKFKKSIKEKYEQDCPDWFTNIVITFDTFDPYGTTFRIHPMNYIFDY